MGEKLKEPLAEAERIVDEARKAGCDLSATGGVGIAICCLSAQTEPLARTYRDLDFVVSGKQRTEVQAFFADQGYDADAEFNSLHGETRMYFRDRENDREADVFIDSIRGCHELDLRGRLGGRTLSPADLLLSKLQVRQTNRKDYTDIFALLLDHELGDGPEAVSRDRLIEVCGSDWGWWRSVVEVTGKSKAVASEILADHSGIERLRQVLDDISDLLEEMPKSRRWKMRARLGERVRWYETPEEVDH